MTKLYTFGNPKHDTVPLAQTPGKVSGVESVTWRNTVHPGEMEAFDYLETDDEREFPHGGRIEVIEFGGWTNARDWLFHPTMQAIDVKLTSKAILRGPICFREVHSDAEATPPSRDRSFADQYVLPALGIAGTIATFAFVDDPFYGFVVGVLAALFVGFSLKDHQASKIPGHVARAGAFLVLGPARKSWN